MASLSTPGRSATSRSVARHRTRRCGGRPHRHRCLGRMASPPVMSFIIRSISSKMLSNGSSRSSLTMRGAMKSEDKTFLPVTVTCQRIARDSGRERPSLLLLRPRYLYGYYSNMSEKSYLSAGENVDESDVVRVALNGFGRIGRNIFRAVLDSPKVELVAINDVMDFDDMAYLAKYDSVMGRLDGAASTTASSQSRAPTSRQPLPRDRSHTAPWGTLTLTWPSRRPASSAPRKTPPTPRRGAEKVVISAPPKGDEPVKQIVYGVNHDEYDGEDIVSNASCTTNSVTPVAKVLDEEFGIEHRSPDDRPRLHGQPEPHRQPPRKQRRGAPPPRTSSRPRPVRRRRPPRSCPSSTASSTGWPSASRCRTAPYRVRRRP